MKINRIIPLLLAALLLLAGCGPASQREEDNKLSLVTTNFAMYDLARAVAGDLCTVTMLIPPGGESHDFEASLADVAKISRADVFVYVGSEDWAEDILLSMGEEAEGVRLVNALEAVAHHGGELVYEDGVCVLSDGHDHDHDHHDLAPDEHCWLSIGNALAVLDEITEAVIAADESLTEAVLSNRDRYASWLKTVDEAYYEMMEHAKRNKILVADRFPFAYMTARYGIDYAAAFSGCTSDTEPSLGVIRMLVETVQDEEIPVILVTEGSDRKTAEAVATETGVPILELHSGQSVTKAEWENGVTLAHLMEKNLAVLKTALGVAE